MRITHPGIIGRFHPSPKPCTRAPQTSFIPTSSSCERWRNARADLAPPPSHKHQLNTQLITPRRERLRPRPRARYEKKKQIAFVNLHSAANEEGWRASEEELEL
ncbi:hypothetical protein DM02DRAFT_45492 [Periconia macrospinosa]|uniref:Uncharacterized protein n=1 Tax=Periconia macrospinosa TaxID=97972 RepID=A0A2V1DJY5_9PLEO|nr:hypothetical protein DM02DRAFT_45492 [Periconia macrospinosa]